MQEEIKENEEKATENSSLPPSKEEKKRKKMSKETRNKIATGVIALATAVTTFFIGMGVSPLFMDEEMRALMMIKNQIQREYYYGVTDEQFYDTIFDAINNDLLDPYSAYMTREEYSLNLSQADGNRVGSGIVSDVWERTDGTQEIYVRFVRGNSPAERAGLERGDRVLAIGEAEDDLIALTKYDELKDFLGTQYPGDVFYVQYERGGVTDVIPLSTASFVENYVYYRTGDTSYEFTGDTATTWTETSSPIVGLPADTAYIRLAKFNGGAAGQFGVAMSKFKEQGKKHLVLDLRDNGGGYMDILCEIASYFCKDGQGNNPTVAVARYKDGSQEYFNASRNVFYDYFSTDSKIYVLADDGTASASECLIGAMVDYGALSTQNICLTERNGIAKTYGKGIMQTTFTFGFGYVDAIRLTTAQIHWPKSGTCIHGVGLTPTNGCAVTPFNFSADGEVYGGLTSLGIL
ncbi:MAG: PDZ domain-containing protein [Clostridia bacterium]|nr:PDZ domain-containing protein [Clostridia bacterium]